MPAPMAAQNTAILCVDDETGALAVRKRLLEAAGYRVMAVRSAEEAIGLFQSDSFDLVICDYWMPGTNGIATSREIRRINKSIPLIILSGLSPLPDEMIGIADRWIAKGEGPEFLLRAIRSLLVPGS